MAVENCTMAGSACMLHIIARRAKGLDVDAVASPAFGALPLPWAPILRATAWDPPGAQLARGPPDAGSDRLRESDSISTALLKVDG